MPAGEIVLKPVSNSELLKLTSDSGTPSSTADLIEAAVAMAISCFSCKIKGTLAVIGDEGGHRGGVALVIDPDKGSIVCSRQRTSRHYESTIFSFIYVIIKIPLSKISRRITEKRMSVHRRRYLIEHQYKKVRQTEDKICVGLALPSPLTENDQGLCSFTQKRDKRIRAQSIISQRERLQDLQALTISAEEPNLRPPGNELGPTANT